MPPRYLDVVRGHFCVLAIADKTIKRSFIVHSAKNDSKKLGNSLKSHIFATRYA